MMQNLQNLNMTSISPFSITVQSNGNKFVFLGLTIAQMLKTIKKPKIKICRFKENPLYSNSCSEEAALNTPSWLNCSKETSTTEEKQEDCLGQETRVTDITPVENYTWDFWFQPPCLCETQRSLADCFCLRGSLNQHGYHSILQRCAICFALRGAIRCFSTRRWPLDTPPRLG